MTALSNLVVLDASRVLAGPYCGQLFADQGAEVIKIEARDGDPSREWPIQVDGLSTTYLSVNRNKKCVTINMTTDEGQRLFYGLVKKADVLIHNYLPETAAKLGIADEELERINPDLIRVSISGYGAKGSKSRKPGYDTMLTAYSGIMSLTGECDGPAVKPGVSAVDLATGIFAYSGAVTALLARDRNNVRGQRVEASLLETAVSLLGVHALNWLIAGKVDQREGANYGPIVPFGRYQCKDGDLMIVASNQKFWLQLCLALDAKHLSDNALYETNELRHRNQHALRRDLEDVLRCHTISEWSDRLDAAGVPSSPVNNVDQVFADAQVLANDMVIETQTTDGRKLPLLGFPFKLSKTAGKIGTAPPALGEHNAEIFRRYLGLTGEEISRLQSTGII